MMYSEVGPKCHDLMNTLIWIVTWRYQTDPTIKGCSQICNLKAKVKYSTKFNVMENMVEQGDTLSSYKSSQTTGKCDKWQEK